MDIEFIVQDVYALVRPQWKLATNFDEALKAFQLAMAQDQKMTGADKAMEQDDGAASDDESSEDENENADELAEAVVEADEEASSVDGDDDGEVRVLLPQLYFQPGLTVPQDDLDQRESAERSESEDEEEIVVTREEEEVDPEDEAEFEREYARIMAESLESRKFDRKPMFDVALPVRSKRDLSSTATEGGDGGGTGGGGGDGEQSAGGTPTMAFSLLTKRGNRQQTRTLELPSDSDFAVAMRSQQQASVKSSSASRISC